MTTIELIEVPSAEDEVRFDAYMKSELTANCRLSEPVCTSWTIDNTHIPVRTRVVDGVGKIWIDSSPEYTWMFGVPVFNKNHVDTEEHILKYLGESVRLLERKIHD